MKKYLLFIAVLAFVLPACKKDKVTPRANATKQYSVSFRVTGFTRALAPFVITQANNGEELNSSALPRDAVSDTLAKYIGVLYFLVFDSNNVLVRSIHQTSADSSFGSISLMLDPGKYRVVATAGQNTSEGTFQMSTDTTNQFVYELTTNNQDPPVRVPFQDTFYQSEDITVGSSGSTYSMTLSRIVGQLEIDIQDAIPANAHQIKVTLTNDYDILKLDGSAEEAIPRLLFINDPAAGSTNNKMYDLILNTATNTSADIVCLDASGNVIAERVVNGINFEPNKTTLVTGDLFTTSQNSGVNAGYNPAWKVQTINYTF